MRFKKFTAAVLAIVALGAAVTWHAWDNRAEDSAEHVAPDKTELAERKQVQPAATRPIAASTNRPAPMPETAPPESLKSLLAYEASDNLAELVSRLAPVAATGDSGAKWIFEKAIHECSPQGFLRNPYQSSRKHAETLPEPQRALKMRHLDRSEQRCRQLIAEGQVTRDREVQAAEVALQGTDLTSEALRLQSSPEPVTGHAARELQRRIVASHDPWAIWAMADVMAAKSEDGEKIYGPFSGTLVDQWAWKLVACRLGYPCGPDSVEVRTSCIVFGQCTNDGMREVIRHYYLIPYEYVLAQETEEKLLTLIAAGDVNAIFP